MWNQSSLLRLSGVGGTHAGATAVVEGLGTLLPGVLTLFNLSPSRHPLGEGVKFSRLRPSNNHQTSADTEVSTRTRFSAYSEVSIALLVFMHDYSERRGQLRWGASDVARCARQRNENG